MKSEDVSSGVDASEECKGVASGEVQKTQTTVASLVGVRVSTSSRTKQWDQLKGIVRSQTSARAKVWLDKPVGYVQLKEYQVCNLKPVVVEHTTGQPDCGGPSAVALEPPVKRQRFDLDQLFGEMLQD